jgi:hypothetical protein
MLLKHVSVTHFVKFILSKEAKAILQNDGFKTITPSIHVDNVSSISQGIEFN